MRLHGLIGIVFFFFGTGFFPLIGMCFATLALYDSKGVTIFLSVLAALFAMLAIFITLWTFQALILCNLDIAVLEAKEAGRLKGNDTHHPDTFVSRYEKRQRPTSIEGHSRVVPLTT